MIGLIREDAGRLSRPASPAGVSSFFASVIPGSFPCDLQAMAAEVNPIHTTSSWSDGNEAGIGRRAYSNYEPFIGHADARRSQFVHQKRRLSGINARYPHHIRIRPGRRNISPTPPSIWLRAKWAEIGRRLVALRPPRGFQCSRSGCHPVF